MSEYIIECDYDLDEGWIPGEHREEIVRCRDCECYEPNLYRHFTCEQLQFYVEPDGFCAWPIRKEVAK